MAGRPERGTLARVKRGIEATTTLQVSFEQVSRVLADDPGAIVLDGDVEQPDRPGEDGHLRSTLGVEVGATAFRQVVDVEIGSLTVTDADVALPLRWRASGRDRLFPVFDGRLEASPVATGTGTVLSVVGVYTVPLGPVGRFGDGLIGRRLARQSLTAFLEDAAGRIEADIHRFTTSEIWRPSPYHVALREVAVAGD